MEINRRVDFILFLLSPVLVDYGVGGFATICEREWCDSELDFLK